MIGESSFTREDAVAAGALDGKNAHTWKKFPRNMMFARAMSNGVRWYCPDIFTGTVVYTPDELDEATDEEGNLDNPSQPLISVPATVVSPPVETAPLPVTNGNGHPHNERVKQIRTLLGIDGKAVLEWLKTEMVVNSPAELETQQVDELVQWMAVQWAAKQGMQHNHATNSFKKNVGAMVQHGYEEVDAITAWMQHVAEKQAVAVG